MCAAALACGPRAVDVAAVPVIIDTDIGDDIDDAFALALAVCDPRLEVVGVTTAFGDTAARARLARRLLREMGRPDIPVARGAATADPTPFTQRDWATEEPDDPAAPGAVEFIASQASKRPGEITLLALAPMTNLEALIRADSSSYRKLGRIVMMGGSIDAGYRSDPLAPGPPSAEYNVAQAPGALSAVLGGDVPLTMFPLDSTQIRLEAAERDELFARVSATSVALRALYEQWRVSNAWKQVTPTLFDAAPVAWVADPALCAPQPLRIAVGLDGFTRVVPGEPNMRACLTMREDAVRRLLMAKLTEGPSRPRR